MAKPNLNKIAGHMEEILSSLGHDMEDPNFTDTPMRFAKFMLEFKQPFDPEDVLKATFPVDDGFHSIVTQDNIPFRGLCAHHLAPMLGRCAIGYIPSKKVVGLSKMARLVEAVGTETPGIQEGFCDRIADLMMEYLEPKGVIVVIQAEHGCMACRGIATPEVRTSTASVRGAFRDVPHAREEFYRLIGRQ